MRALPPAQVKDVNRSRGGSGGSLSGRDRSAAGEETGGGSAKPRTIGELADAGESAQEAPEQRRGALDVLGHSAAGGRGVAGENGVHEDRVLAVRVLDVLG